MDSAVCGGQDWGGLTFSASSSLVRGVQYALVALGTTGSLYVGRRLISQNGLGQARLAVFSHVLAVADLLGAYVAIFLYS